MVKMVLLLKRRAGMRFEDFIDYYETRHAPLGCGLLPGAKRYQRRFLRPLAGIDGAQPDDGHDCITEIWFDNRADMDAALAFASQPANAALLAADEENLFDRSRIRFYIVDSEPESDLTRSG